MHDVGVLGGGVSRPLHRLFSGRRCVESPRRPTRSPGGPRAVLRHERLPVRHRRAHLVFEGQGGALARDRGARRQRAPGAAGQQDSLRGPARQIPVRERHRRFAEGSDRRHSADVHRKSAPRRSPPISRVALSHVRRRADQSVHAPVQCQDLEDPTRRHEPRVGRPGASPAAPRSPEDRRRHLHGGLHAPAPLSLSEGGRLRVDAAGGRRQARAPRCSPGSAWRRSAPAKAAGP